MAGYADAAHVAVKSPVSIPWVVLASALAGLGVFAMVLFLYTFQLIYLGGILPIVTGTLMLFDRRAGADSAA